jgi:hypothetical protein
MGPRCVRPEDRLLCRASRQSAKPVLRGVGGRDKPGHERLDELSV